MAKQALAREEGAREARAQGRGLEEAPAEGGQPPAEAGERIPRRGQTALQLFRRDWLRQQKVLGNTCNACSKASWQAVKLEFEALGRQRMEDYEREAVATAAAARVHRQVRNLVCPAVACCTFCVCILAFTFHLRRT